MTNKEEHKRGRVIATRTLQRLGRDRGKVRVRIFEPRRRAAEEWSCSFEVDDLGGSEAFGIDSMQALQNAVEGIRATLAGSTIRLQWRGGEPGDVGFSRSVPLAFGLKFARDLEDLIDEEIARLGLAAERQARRGKLPGEEP